MMIALGNFLFRYRNALGPALFLLALIFGQPAYPFGDRGANHVLDLCGALLALSGQGLRIVTIGYEYIERGGRHRQVYASKLVQGGVFAHCRNPLYAGNILMAAGFALIVHSYAFYFGVMPGIVFAYMAIVAAEENFLRNKFGAEYEAYCRRVNRWLPRLAGWRRSTHDMRFNWKRVVVKEYNTMFLLLASLVILKVWSEYRIAGPAALPGAMQASAGVLIWLILYLSVRSLKKSGYIKV